MNSYSFEFFILKLTCIWFTVFLSQISLYNDKRNNICPLARASQGRSGQKAYSILDILEERESELRAANNSRLTKEHFWFLIFVSF